MIVKPLQCSRCGAGLSDPGTGELITCEYCGNVHTVHRQAPERGSTRYAPGQPVLVEWGSTWWNARVVAEVGRNRWRIRYDGYSADHDETVGSRRIRPADDSTPDDAWDPSWDAEPDDAPPAPPAVSPVAQVAPQVPAPYAPPAAMFVTFGVGAAVDVFWQSRWYAATVLRVEGPAAWRIHYVGYGNDWDEIVGPERIRPRQPMSTTAKGTAVAVGFAVVAGLVAAMVFLTSAQRGTVPATGTTVSAPTSVGERVPGAEVTATTPLTPGAPVWALWGARWYAAEVLEAQPSGAVRVHYVGYGASFDEALARDHLRLRSAGE